MRLEALIFDVDGTLVETEEAHRQAFNDVFAAHRVGEIWPDPERSWRWDRETYARLLLTTGGKERIAAYLRDDLALDPAPWRDRIAEIHAEKTARFATILTGSVVALRPGVAETVAWARAKGVRLAIATTTSRPNVDAVAEAGFGCAAEAVFEVIAAGDEVRAKKPAPDVYELALERLGLPAAACLAIEDSRNGVLSAKAAGIRCIASPGLYTRDDDLGDADLVADALSPAAVRGFMDP